MASTARTAQSLSLLASRPTSASFAGKAEEALKTLVHEQVKLDFGRWWRERGYPSESDCLRELVMVAMYGSDYVSSLHVDRIESMSRNLSVIGPKR